MPLRPKLKKEKVMHRNRAALSAGAGLILLNVKSLFAVFTIECSAVQVSAGLQCTANIALQ